MSSFTWLHLSDLHRGQPGDVNWIRAKDVFRKDLEARVKELGEPDALFFTGDLSYSGLDEEYVEVDKTIDEIRDVVGDALLVPVPGNHDASARTVVVLKVERVSTGFEVAVRRVTA